MKKDQFQKSAGEIAPLRPWYVRRWRWVAGALIVGPILGYAARTPWIVVAARQNGEFLASQYRIQEDDFSHPRLKLLRRREHLDDVVAPGKTQFDKIRLLQHWAHKQWKTSDNFY